MKKIAEENLKDDGKGVRPRMIFTLTLLLMGFIHDPEYDGVWGGDWKETEDASQSLSHIGL